MGDEHPAAKMVNSATRINRLICLSFVTSPFSSPSSQVRVQGQEPGQDLQLGERLQRQRRIQGPLQQGAAARGAELTERDG